MHKSWSKGFTKENNLSVRKISETMKRKKIDNLKKWREGMKALGKIRTSYPEFEKNGDLAELIGMILGDGHIEEFPRTERLYITNNSEDVELIKRYGKFVADFFEKEPVFMKVKTANCVVISLYQKFISKRLKIPTGSRKNLDYKLHKWIKSNEKYLIRFLRGLYEAEGSFCVHKPTSTYKLFFTNKNDSLLEIVFNSLEILGFHPHKSRCNIQVSRKEEVYRLKDLLEFRKYNIN